MQATSTSQKIKAICHKVTTPSDSSTAATLSKLFGYKSTSGQKRSFDPSSPCVVASQKK